MNYNPAQSSITVGGFASNSTTDFNYVNEALRTLSDGFYIEKITPNILHGAIGLSTESGEILDAVKKTLFYGKDFDTVNLQEEIGDAFWYLAILAHEAGMSFEAIMHQNISKLRKRFPEKFTEDKALNRDLNAERADLEANSM